MNEQAERLRALYATLPEEELTRLHEQRDELTDEAQNALACELKARGFYTESFATPDEHAGTVSEEGFFSLWGFWDPMRANEALSILEKAEIDAHLVPGETRDRGDGTEATFFELLVAKDEEEAAVLSLRKHLGLFPLPEAVHSSYSDADGDDDSIAIAQFESLEELAIAERALTGAGIAFRKSEERLEGHTFWSIDVAADAMERAGSAIEKAFANGVAAEAAN